MNCFLQSIFLKNNKIILQYFRTFKTKRSHEIQNLLFGKCMKEKKYVNRHMNM